MNRVVSLSAFREDKEMADGGIQQPDLSKFSNRLAGNLELSKTIDRVAKHILIDLGYENIEGNPKINIIRYALIRLYRSGNVNREYHRNTQDFDGFCDHLIEKPAGSCYDMLLYFFGKYIDDRELLIRLFRRCGDKFGISKVFRADGLTGAIDSKNRNKVKMFLDNGLVPAPSFDRDGALFQAILIKDLEIFKMIFEYIGDIDYYDYTGKTLFHLAIQSGAFEIAKYLFAEGADLDAQDDRLCTATMNCVHLGYLDMFEFLIKNHADTSLIDNAGINLFAHIVIAKRADFFNVFIKYNCDVSQKEIQYAFNTFLIFEETSIMLKQLIARKGDEIVLDIKKIVKISKSISIEAKVILREFILKRFSGKAIPIQLGVLFPDLN